MSILGNFQVLSRQPNVFAVSQNIENCEKLNSLSADTLLTQKKNFNHHVHVSEAATNPKATWSAGSCVVIEPFTPRTPNYQMIPTNV